MTRDDDRDAIITPLFDFDFDLDCAILADPNCPMCLQAMQLEGMPGATFWVCPDADCRMTQLF